MSRVSSSSASRIQVPGVIHGLEHSISAQVLIDSEADDNFIDCNFVKTRNISTRRLSTPKEVQAVDSKLLEVVAYKTEPFKTGVIQQSS